MALRDAVHGFGEVGRVADLLESSGEGIGDGSAEPVLVVGGGEVVDVESQVGQAGGVDAPRLSDQLGNLVESVVDVEEDRFARLGVGARRSDGCQGRGRAVHAEHRAGRGGKR